ncbi:MULTISPECIES: pyruvate dehydrogenase (acetyl-transferring) E1 component subunit alpha [Lysinibacillus]|uniref:Pyruvate dehydrogenase E1 component subunit alpha n=1 Tax=Lysinibacillus antri TaxID=2498145 RepID=A0A432LB56_9BACI|nr:MULTISPECIES: pyruvate dehydrogenase (acetyl-transferring) E1 component subunit alpha [Lysinibacillus]RUL51757.1 pyruvate dehydrogenase (acetyl-transferring) E1 component subunit alpha [Lysinibacillus antri]TSI04512.1 pyruvate dehydrogenase (acetyl-transferring) E1 component subunit alpha [Lysinibacillus sp. BW-2-10]
MGYEQQFPLQQVVDHNGELVLEGYESKISQDLVLTFYRHLIRVRAFDRKAKNLQRQGRIGTYALFEGQEAAQVGSALALQKDDWMYPTYRDHAASITFGHSLPTILSYWNGRFEGGVPPKGKRIVPPSVPIATQLPLATGTAMAEKYKGTSNAVICYFGDGATSEGDFHEGMNFASVVKAPVVFFNQNNSYAISVPIWKQMNSPTIAQKAVAYNIPGVRIDGNDIFIVYFETMKALERARNGEGPTLIEAVTWRYGAHTTADDPTKYRDQEESEKRREYDPITRLERFMKNYGHWNEEWVQKVQEEVEQEINQAVIDMEAMPKPDVNDMFDYIFAQPTWTIQEQKDAYLKHLRGEA